MTTVHVLHNGHNNYITPNTLIVYNVVIQYGWLLMQESNDKINLVILYSPASLLLNLAINFDSRAFIWYVHWRVLA